jgi:LysR family transcriptional regulator, nod-box dependent transcriptional activator
MRLGHFDLNLLVALDALLETKSVTKAADRLCIGPSATSSALGRLRTHFDDELLTVIGRRMELTPLAQGLVQPVRDIIMRTQATLRRKPGFDPATEVRHFIFNVSDYVTTVLMPKVLQRLEQEAPGISIDFLPLGNNALELLDRGEVDFAIFPDHYAGEQHASEPLFDDTYSCVIWAENPLIGDTLTFEDYVSLGHIAAKFGDSRIVSYEGRFLSSFGTPRKVEVTVSYFNALPQLVVGTKRVATMHTRLAKWYAQHLPLKVFPLPFEIAPLQMVMQWHRICDEDPAHQWLRCILKEVAEKG